MIIVIVWLLFPMYVWGPEAMNLAVPGAPLPKDFWFYLAVLSAWTVFMGCLMGRR